MIDFYIHDGVLTAQLGTLLATILCDVDLYLVAVYDQNDEKVLACGDTDSLDEAIRICTCYLEKFNS